MKLTSMTDFVLKTVQTANINEAICWEQTQQRLDKIYQYSLFLKQPLTLGMFVKIKGIDKTLFKGFRTEYNAVITPNGSYMDEYRLNNKTIEDIIYLGYELTESAIKKIGL